MNKKKKSRFGDLNFLGIPIDPTLGVGDKVLDHVDESIEAKKRKEAIEIFGKVGEKERVKDNEFELKTIEAYLPKQMGEEEVKKEIAKIAKESGKKGGVLIGEVMKALKGEADGGLVARIVNQEYA